MKTTLTPLDPADFIGPAPVTEPDPSQPDGASAGDDAGSPIAEKTDVSDGEDSPRDSEATSERFIGPRVKLTVEVDAETFDTDIEAAFRKLAREVRIPGFRPGRAPRRVLESHFGSEIGRAQALEEAVPRYYAEAVRDNHVDVVNQPELELTLDGSDGPVAFEATVEIRPVVSVSGYEDLQIEIPSPVPTDEEIDARIDETRRQFADIAEVDRAAAQGDRVTIDIEGSVEGEPLPGLAAQDYLYEVGSGGIVPEVDEHLTGCEAGTDLSFSAPHPVQPEMEIDFEITVNTVSELVLPELTDDWVDENTEHDSVAELRDATARQLSFGRIMQANMVLREEAQKQIADLVEGPVPDAMISGAIADRMQELGSGLQQRNMTIEEWLEATGQEPASFIGELRDDAERGVRLDLALRAVAAAESLEADDDDIDGELERMAATDGRSAAQLREVIADTDGLAHLSSAICKSKALQWAIEAATLIGPDGDTIERSALELPTADDAGGTDDTDDDLDGTDSDDRGDTP
ncbi:trigger factor [Candidatus Poriferisodalis sp.]|uniref:trigger factor n=1 Tax=Candidatus Poriferisodalis sp. TaxID=3101277 RepID=UPI003B59D3B5